MIPVVVIVGRANVGKSTLFNRLSRTRSALVDDRPGITRDRLLKTVSHQGVPFILVDTGGFEDPGGDALAEKVKLQVETALEEADRIIFMVDAHQGLIPADRDIASLLRRSNRRAFLAVNKVDGREQEPLAAEFYGIGFDPIYPVSAANGYGLRSLMDAVIQDLPIGKPARDPDQIRVAVLGRPNTGKSSLINCILGAERVLVSEAPGTTRDTVDTPFTRQGHTYLLIDTAGIRKKTRVREKIERFSMIRAIKSLERCHVAVVLLDAAQGATDQDARICGYAIDRSRAVILAANKWDLVKDDARKQELLTRTMERKLKFLSFAPWINVSALTGERVPVLLETVEVLYRQYSCRIETAEINRAVQEMVQEHSPPRGTQGRLKFFYATQTETRPPTFLIFVNRPELIHFSYERYITNQLRKRFALDWTPIRLRFKRRR